MANDRQPQSRGGMPEWLKGADCKSAGFCLRRFESYSLHQLRREAGAQRWSQRAGVAQLARVSAFQAEGCGFETHHPLQICARVAQW